jgi:hypothetical protein
MNTTLVNETSTNGTARSLRLSAKLLMAGQLLYITVTQLHTGGDANDHHAIFSAYAESGIWTAVHIAQFAGVAVLVAGLLGLFSAVRGRVGSAEWAVMFGAASSTAALALYGALQAVDGVALKQAVNAWVGAPAADKAARFATAEGIRWLEWGLRSYHDFALGVALVLAAVVLARTAGVARPISYLAGLAGGAYLLQGWELGATAFSHGHSMLIVLGWLLSLVWMPWLYHATRSAGVLRVAER